MDVRRRQAATDTLTPTTVTTYLLIAASVRIITMSALRTAAQRVASRAVISPRVSTRTFASTSTIRNRDPALGDYPDVPAVSRQMRKWNKDWWDQQEKANFGETVSISVFLCPEIIAGNRFDKYFSHARLTASPTR